MNPEDFALFLKFKQFVSQSPATKSNSTSAATKNATSTLRTANEQSAEACSSSTTSNTRAKKSNRASSGTSKSSSTFTQFTDNEIEPTHALVLWEVDNRYSVVPINSHIKKHNAGERIEEQKSYKVTWKSSTLDATVISLGTQASCNTVFEMMKKNETQSRPKPKTKPSIESSDNSLRNEEINIYKVMYLFRFG